MEYEVYIDVIFLVNFLMDYMLLWLVAAIFHYPAKLGRKLLGGFVGAIGVCILVIIPVPMGIGYFLCAGVISFFMIFITFEPRGYRMLLKQAGCLYLLTYALGGVMNWLLFQTQIGYIIQSILMNPKSLRLGVKNFLIITACSFVLLKGLSRSMVLFQKGKDVTMKVTLIFDDGVVKTVGLLDTGNGLSDPMTGKPVIVGEYEAVKSGLKETYQIYVEDYIKEKKVDYSRIEQEGLKNIRMIPYQSVGEENGTMIGVLCRFCIIEYGKKEMKHENIVVALTENKLSGGHEYFVILHPELVD